MRSRFENNYFIYEQILDRITSTGKYMDFQEAIGKKNYIVLRHDVEFSIKKAAEMAKIEAQYGVKTSYFVQLENSAYNPFSDENKELIREITGYGHKIGLHYRQQYDRGPKEIEQQAEFMSRQYGIPIDRFSCHRPKEGSHYERIQVPGLINVYAEDFFDRTDETAKAKVLYISDSGFRWNYGFPDLATLSNADRVQILIHPFQWDSSGSNLLECFEHLLREKKNETIETYSKEYKRYNEIEETISHERF